MKTMILTLGLLALVDLAQAAGFDDDLLSIQRQWAHIQYELPEAEQEKALEVLADEAAALVKEYPAQAEVLIWQGIVLSTFAGAKGGLGALPLVKAARQVLERALAINDRALEGSAYTSLGSLYYQVPGWPLSFGDDELAEQHLQAALRINPDGIDPNFFFGDFLLEQGQPPRARVYLERALMAPDRHERPLADAGRRREIQARLDLLGP